MLTPPPHKVIALISGGKDSFLALLHCLAQKNDIVALANLYPAPAPPTPTHDFPSPSNDPNDSHMYQTAGHTLIPLYALALRIPLYRGQISRWGALSLERNYSFSFPEKENLFNDEDETESLLSLLRRVKESHLDASAVCSGAILSTYQRTRIESVALRLGLVPLAPLWQYPFLPRQNPGGPEGLLEDIGLVGLKARIIKVASGGLDEGLLWGDLSDRKIRHKVKNGVGRFGGSVLGEGGEYETIVVDGPRGVWKRGISVDENLLVVRRGEAGEAWLDVEEGAGRITTEDTAAEEEVEQQGWRKRLVIPGLWDEGFEGLIGRIRSGETAKGVVEATAAAAAAEKLVTNPNSNARWTPQPNITQNPTSLHLSNLTSPSPKTSAPTQMANIITSHLLPFLTQHSLPPSSIIFTTLLLRSISDFTSLNQAYGTIFTSPLPPARVTVACGDSLPADVHVMASFVLDLTSHKDGLHVQSRSYWAPANIGPYSQAISVPLALPPPLPPLAAVQDDLSNLSFSEPDDWSSEGELVYIAGQIPLVPITMNLVSPFTSSSSPSDATAINTTTTLLNGTDDDDEADLLSFRTQTALSLQHLFSIGKTMKVSWWTGAVAFITAPDPQRKARIASEAWKIVHGGSSSSSVFNIMPSVITNNNKDPDDDDDNDGLDAWDKKYGAGRKKFCFGGEGQGEEEEGHKKIPNWEHVKKEGVGGDGAGGLVPGFFAVEVSELPRNALIEWSALGLRHSHITISPPPFSSSSSSCSIRLPPQTTTTTTTTLTKSQRKKTTTIRSFHYIPIPLSSSSTQPEVDIDYEVTKFLHTFLYGDKETIDDSSGSRRGRRGEGVEITVYTASPKDLRHGKGGGLVIPVNGVYGEEGQKLAAGVVLSLWTMNEESAC